MTRSPAYCTAANVHSQLQIQEYTEFLDNGTTKPTLTEVNNWIMRSEDYLEQRTRTAWRAVTVTDEYHGYMGVQPDPLFTEWNDQLMGHPFVKPRYGPLQTFTSGTHKIELWDGSEWTDLVLTANGYTEGRGDDYYIDYTRGVIFFVDKVPMVGRNTIRLTYSYGHSSVPLDVEDAAIKLAALEAVLTQDKTGLPTEGGRSPAPMDKEKAWHARVEEVISRHKRILSASI